jgi:hypothetical protein
VVPAGTPGAGDIVAVGYRANSSCGAQVPTPVVAEYVPSGALNTASFGPVVSGTIHTGFVTGTSPAPLKAPFPAISCPAQGGEFNAVTIDPSGDIYAAGVAFGAANAPSTLVASLSSTGTALNSLYPSIGSSPPPSFAPPSVANAVAIAAVPPAACPAGECLGDIITAGFSIVGGQQYLTVSAYINCPTTVAPTGCPNGGALDPAFGTQGSVSASGAPGSTGAATTVVPISNSSGQVTDYNVVVAGNTGTNLLLARYSSIGAPISTFGSGGLVINTPNLGTNDGFTGLAYQPFGNTLSAAGFVGSGSSKEMVVAQYNATTGTPNKSFGSTGAFLRSFGPFPSSLAAVAVQADGKTVGAGRAPVLNAAPGIGLIRVAGPTLSVVDNSRTTSVLPGLRSLLVNFHVTVNEPLFNTVPARFCASPSQPVRPVLVNGSAGCGTVNIPAGTPSTTQVVVPVRIPITVRAGQTQITTLTASSTNGLTASATQGSASLMIRVL